MKCQRGDVVLVNYPFSEGVGSKIRPAVIVQCDINNWRLESTLIVQVTSRISRVHSEPTQLLIEMNSRAGRQSGLLKDSAVSCENLFTVRRNTILRTIGTLPDDTMQQLDVCLKASLGIE